MSKTLPNVTHLDVWFKDQKVGTLAQIKDGRIAFAYDSDWISNGFSLNPISLPLLSKVFIPSHKSDLDGLFGVFFDSLPDGWGRLLTDRFLKKQGIDLGLVNSLTRLALITSTSAGALQYKPSLPAINEVEKLSLEQTALESQKLFAADYTEKLDVLFEKGGTSGGARPKTYWMIDGEEWIVKFPCSADPKDIALQEFSYMECADACGIEVPEHKLIPSENVGGYFASKRFDRRNINGRAEKVHLVSVSSLLETSHRIPNLDYEQIMKVCQILTKDEREVWKVFRLACFNVFAHNRDDHGKNFSFLYDDDQNAWKFAPAYDLTWSNSYGGEHATTIHGNGRNPGKKDLLSAAKAVGLDQKQAAEVIDFIESRVQNRLKRWVGKGH